jgi:hypothetical protein
MEALELFKIRERMCKQGCKKCPVSYCNNGFQLDCLEFMLSHPEKFVQLVEKWAAENPIKSRASVLKEVFPNVGERNGVPNVCPRVLEGKTSREYNCVRKTCWDCVKEYWEGEYVK